MNLPDLSLPLLLTTVVARTVIILAALIVGIRVFGERGVGDLDLVDILMVLLIGNAVQNALTYGSGNLAIGLVAAAVLIAADRLLGVVFSSSPWLEKSLFGEPTVIAQDGKLDRDEMRRQGVTEEEVQAALRQQGLHDLSDVRLGVLEDEGTISIIPYEPKDGEQGE